MIRWVAWSIAVLGVSAAGVYLILVLGRMAEQPSTAIPDADAQAGAPMRAIRLHFPSEERIGWRTEDRVVHAEDEEEILAERIVRELLSGPARGPGAWSDRVEVRTFFLDEDGVGVLDLSPHVLADWPRGDAAEWVVVGSAVRSLAENLSGLRGLQILVDGEVVRAPPGSIPLDLPLRPEWFQDEGREGMR